VGLDDIALCDNFYTPRIRPEVAWDLKAMVETIAELSEIFGAPFISGKDSSSGTFKSDTGELIDVPYTLVVSMLGRMSDVRKAVMREFKQAGNRLILLGTLDPDRLGGSVYLDAFGERGDRLSDWGNEWAKDLVVMYRRLHDFYWNENPVKSASAIAEGGLLLRLFEAAMGSGLGADIDLGAFPKGRRDGALFSEAVGAFLLELDSSSDPADLFCGLPWIEIGRVTDSPELAIRDGSEEVLTMPVEDLVRIWERPFAEVVR